MSLTDAAYLKAICEIETLKAENEKLRTEYEALDRSWRSKHNVATLEIATLKVDLAALRADRDLWIQRDDNSQAQLQYWRAELDALRTKYEELYRQFQNGNDDYSALATKYSELRTKYEALRAAAENVVDGAPPDYDLKRILSEQGS